MEGLFPALKLHSESVPDPALLLPNAQHYKLSSGSRVFAPIHSTLKIHPDQALGVLQSNSLLTLTLTHFLALSFIIRSSVLLDIQ